MNTNWRVLTLAMCAFGLSLATCFIAALNVKGSVGDGIFALSFIDGTAAFSKKDIDFLNRENCYFTFTARLDEEASTETAKTRTEVVGTNADFANITGMKVISGFFFNDIHIKKLSNTAVLNSAAAWYFFGNINCVGNKIDINGKQYHVVGVIESCLENGDSIRIFLPFEVLEKEQQGCYICEVLIASESHSATETLMTDMGYLPEDLLILDLELYKNVMMQRVRIVVFLCGLCVIVYLVRMCLLNIKAISRDVKLFNESNYAADIRLLVKGKRFLFKLILLAAKLLLIFLVMNIIKFKVCLPYYFFSISDLNYSTLTDLLSFFIQPHVTVPVFKYLNVQNLVSNVMFFTSMLLGTVILSIIITKCNSLNFTGRNL